MSNVVLPSDTLNTGKAIATSAVSRDGITEYVQLNAIADATSGTTGSVTSAGVSGSAAIAVQGVTNGVAIPVNPQSNPGAVSGSLIAPSTAITSAGNSTTFACGAYRSLLLFANITVVSGTSPAITLTLQTQDAVSGNWVTLSGYAFTSLNAVGTYALAVGAPNGADFGSTVRLTYTVSGTSPSFTLGVSYIAK